jgi:thiamine biosynthesis lipoprotein
MAGELGRRPFLKLAAGGLAAGAALAGGWTVVNRDRNLFQIRHERTLMETSVSINVFCDDAETARRAIDGSFRRMEAAVGMLSRFEPGSPVSRLNREGHLADVPADLRTVVGRALEISTHTDGDFDITVAPVLDYFYGLNRPVLLNADMRRVVAERKSLIGYRSIRLDEAGLRFSTPGMRVTLDAVAKGFVVDQGIAALRAAGIERALVDAGGDLRAITGTNPDHFWNVGIVDPLHTDRVAAVVRLQNSALSTSGNYQVFFSADRRLFHIVNPHTGYSPEGYSSITVVAGEVMEADAMSVAAFSMTLPRLREAMEARGHQWLAFSQDGRARWRSKNLPLVSGDAEVV